MTQSALEPPGLEVFAQHLRDGTWLDVRVVEVGEMQRVRIDSINIHRERDVVVVAQKWVDGEVRSTQLSFDAEDVRWLRETQVALEDVKPTEPPILTVVSWKRVIEEIVRTVAFLTEGITEKDLTSGGKQTGCIRPRQEAMWLAYEMTGLSPLVIATEYFGYASQQPMLTVHQKIECALRNHEPVHYGENVGAWLDGVRITRDLIDSNLGVRARRPNSSPWRCVL